MSTSNQLEKQREDNKVLIEKRDLALKLYGNREFKKLFVDGFFRDECAQYAQMSQDPALGEKEQLDALRIAQAAGHVRRWLSVVVQMGSRAARQNEEIDAEIDQIRLEEAAEEAEREQLIAAGGNPDEDEE